MPSVANEVGAAFWRATLTVEARVAKVPQGIQCPGQILQWITDMGHFPVEHRNNSSGTVVKHVAIAIIAVNDRQPLRGRWRIPP